MCFSFSEKYKINGHTFFSPFIYKAAHQKSWSKKFGYKLAASLCPDQNWIWIYFKPLDFLKTVHFGQVYPTVAAE